MSKRLIMSFKPEHFYPVPPGTILKYLGHNLDCNTKQYVVLCEIIGKPTDGYDEELVFIQPNLSVLDTAKVNIPYVKE